jgi:group I intron endonuclease
MARKISSGIYVITNVINGKQYVGQSIYVKERKTASHAGCPALYNAIKKYGKENFEQEIVEYCELNNLGIRENYWIEKLNTLIPNGYNICPGGDSPLIGYHHREDSKIKMRNAKLGTHPSQETKKLWSKQRSGKGNSNYGKPMSSAQKEKLRLANSGNKSYRFGTKRPDASSVYYGVCRHKSGNIEYWWAGLRVNGKSINIGGAFKTEIDAALAYDKYVRENNLGNPLNFSEEF